VELVERLRRYGLRTLGHVARLGEAALRRQFGERAGALLAAAARGEDAAPLTVTPAPARLSFRMRCDALPAERVLAALPVVALRLARRLHMQGRRVGSLALWVWWEAGGVRQIRVHLRGQTAEASVLARELRRLFVSLLQPGEQITPRATDGICDLRIVLGDLAPARPTQAAFWQPHAQRREALAGLEEVLAQRYPRSERRLLAVPRRTAPAVFHEERYTLCLIATAAPSGMQPPPAPAPVPRLSSVRVPAGAGISRRAHAGSSCGSDSACLVPEPHWW
jgi:hypothetical protein